MDFGLGARVPSSGWVVNSWTSSVVFFVGLVFGEVEAGDLEAVEEQSCSSRVEVVGGYFLQDDADGGLDGAAVLGEG